MPKNSPLVDVLNIFFQTYMFFIRKKAYNADKKPVKAKSFIAAAAANGSFNARAGFDRIMIAGVKGFINKNSTRAASEL